MGNESIVDIDFYFWGFNKDKKKRWYTVSWKMMMVKWSLKKLGLFKCVWIESRDVESIGRWERMSRKKGRERRKIWRCEIG